MKYVDSYLPVDLDFKDHLKKLISERRAGKVHYFDADSKVEDALGTIQATLGTESGEFLIVGDNHVRLDKIITVLGKPGPAYDAYARYANVCLTCEDLDQF